MTRKYSADEEATFRAVGLDPRRAARAAEDSYWPGEFERRAASAELYAANLRLAAAALRREIEAEQVGGS